MLRKISLRFVCLMVLVVGLFILPADLTGQKASGSVCCTVCIEQLTACKQDCPQEGGQARTLCWSACNSTYRPCFNSCYSNC